MTRDPDSHLDPATDARLDAAQAAAAARLHAVLGTSSTVEGADDPEGAVVDLTIRRGEPHRGRRWGLVAAILLVVAGVAGGLMVHRQRDAQPGSVRAADPGKAIAVVQACRAITVEDGGSPLLGEGMEIPLAWRGRTLTGTLTDLPDGADGSRRATFTADGVSIVVTEPKGPSSCPPWPKDPEDQQPTRPQGIDAVRAAMAGSSVSYVARPSGGGWFLAASMPPVGGPEKEMTGSTGGVLLRSDGTVERDVDWPEPMVVLTATTIDDSIYVLGIRCDNSIAPNDQGVARCRPGQLVLRQIAAGDDTNYEIGLPASLVDGTAGVWPVHLFRVGSRVLLVTDQKSPNEAWMLASDGSWSTVEAPPEGASPMQIGDHAVVIVENTDAGDRRDRARVFDADTGRWGPEIAGPDLGRSEGRFSTATATRYVSIAVGSASSKAAVFDPDSPSWQRYDLPGLGGEEGMAPPGTGGDLLVLSPVGGGRLVFDARTGRTAPFDRSLDSVLDLGDGRVGVLGPDASIEVVDLPRP
jgi:hypothetical protein